MSVNKRYELALIRVAGVGAVLSKQLISYCGSAEAVFKTPKGKLLKIPNIGEKIASQIQAFNDWQIVDEEMRNLEKQDVKLFSYTDTDYPKKLKQIPDAPFLLYYKGRASLNSSKTVGIVGTRNATEYGKEVVQYIVGQLTKIEDIVVISGLAYGIDIAAHRACLESQIPTIGVLGSGIDVIYPATHRKTAAEMLENGGLLSELPLGSPPDAPNFPARNRIIAGMSDALIVVEASQTGGALITANLAFDYNREVFACPGSIFSIYSEGCHQLVNTQKSHIFASFDSFLDIMQWNVNHVQEVPAQPEFYPELSLESQKIIAQLQKQDLHIDELSFKVQIPLNQLASLLLSLELDGFIRTLPGKKIALKKKLR